MSAGGIVIAIDGPAASGKSSVARTLAARLGFHYINTGAMYRAVTWHILRSGISPSDHDLVVSALARMRLDCAITGRASTIRIDGDDPEPHLSDAGVAAAVSTVSSIPEVRQLLLERQRQLAGAGSVVMEGRDIGSTVFPGTPYKFYIDASLDVRAQRRQLQGHRDDLATRDRTDSTRKASPLLIAEDAHVIDSSHLTIDGVVGEIVGRLKLKGLPAE